MFPSYLEVEKNQFLAISNLINTVAVIREREKSGSQLFRDQKMQFTTVRSKEKDYDIYLKSEKLVHSQQEHKKVFPSYLEEKKLVLSYFELDKHCCSYLEREKVDPCYLENKKCSSQLLGARKKIMTSI